MLEFTRELVEHYLRATGWTFDPNDGWWLGTDASGNKGRGFPASWLHASGLDADVAARMAGHRVNAVTLAFRLGLCAAAETAIRRQVGWCDEANGIEYCDETTKADEAEACAEFHLYAAGIDRAAWESARGPR